MVEAATDGEHTSGKMVYLTWMIKEICGVQISRDLSSIARQLKGKTVKVSELIELLKDMPQDLEVILSDDSSSAPNPHIYEFYGAVWVML